VKGPKKWVRIVNAEGSSSPPNKKKKRARPALRNGKNGEIYPEKGLLSVNCRSAFSTKKQWLNPGWNQTFLFKRKGGLHQRREKVEKEEKNFKRAGLLDMEKTLFHPRKKSCSLSC